MSSVRSFRLTVILGLLLSFRATTISTSGSSEPDVKPGERISSRVAIRNDGASVPVKTAQELGAVKISFESKAGKKYVIYSSVDLTSWATSGVLVEGTGATVTFNYDPAKSGISFFRVEEIGINPVPNMVWIAPGTFKMGSPLTEQDRDVDEDPVTEVTLTRGMWMGKFEVTQREYEEIMGLNPSWFRGDSSLPVEQVAWKEAVAYCARLTERERLAGRLPSNFAYRLPTEAEFEYAARAGASTRFSYGDDPDYSNLGNYAWYMSNSTNMTHNVGLKTANAFGLHDMQGNVWEWCLDWYTDRYPGGKVQDPTGPSTGLVRAFRGGGWDYIGASCRAAYRNNVSPTRRSRYLGFRVVLSALFTPAAP
jgi:formylglycine-generating enzyme required for sulfatase activity